jgi:hypothetical protein
MASVWCVGVSVDAASTVLMMRSGLYEEANAFAATGMGVVGVEGYVAAVSVLCVLLAIPTLARPPRQLYPVAAWSALAVIGLAKMTVGLSNIALALS